MIPSIYWQVGDLKTNSKAEAIKWAGGDLKKIHFYFYDDEWKNNDYTQEPKKTFEELCINRCRVLRSSCDWLSLWLSSGYDSNTILKYFILSQQKIDEIIIYARPIDKDTDGITALQTAQDYKKYYYNNVKITFLEISYDHMSSIYENLKENFIFQSGFNLRFTKTGPVWQIKHHENVLRAIDRHQTKRIDVCGFEKPKVYLHGEKWYAFVPDSSVYDYLTNFLTGFYVDVNDFDFYLKQHFMVIKWFETLPDLNEKLVHDVQSHKRYYSAWNLACGRFMVNNSFSTNAAGKFLYSNSIQSPDSQKFIEHFFKEKNKIYNYYLEGLANLKNICKWWSIDEDFDKKGTIISSPKFIRERKKNVK